MRFLFLLLLLVSGSLGYWYYETVSNNSHIQTLQKEIRDANAKMSQIDKEMARNHEKRQGIDKTLATQQEKKAVQRNDQINSAEEQEKELLARQQLLHGKKSSEGEKYRNIRNELNGKILELQRQLDTVIFTDKEAINEKERKYQARHLSAMSASNWPAQRAKLVAEMDLKHAQLKQKEHAAEEKIKLKMELAEKKYTLFQEQNTHELETISRKLSDLAIKRQNLNDEISVDQDPNSDTRTGSPKKGTCENNSLIDSQASLQHQYDTINQHANVKLQAELNEKLEALSQIRTWTFIICGFWAFLALLSFSAYSKKESF